MEVVVGYPHVKRPGVRVQRVFHVVVVFVVVNRDVGSLSGIERHPHVVELAAPYLDVAGRLAKDVKAPLSRIVVPEVAKL